MPGPYFDKGTNTHYNYFRDYDPAVKLDVTRGYGAQSKRVGVIINGGNVDLKTLARWFEGDGSA